MQYNTKFVKRHVAVASEAFELGKPYNVRDHYAQTWRRVVHRAGSTEHYHREE